MTMLIKKRKTRTKTRPGDKNKNFSDKNMCLKNELGKNNSF